MSAMGRTVGAALRGRPASNSIFWNRIDQSFDKEIDSTPGGHGGPPLQYVPQFARGSRVASTRPTSPKVF
jgi:hypothetical protein